MRIDNVRDLGLYVRDQRRRAGLTQGGLSAAARVSRRWLSDFEAGKDSVEIGLVFRVLHALKLVVEAGPIEFGPDDIDLDEVLCAQQARAMEGTARG